MHFVLNLGDGVRHLSYRAELLTVQYYSDLSLLFLVSGKIFVEENLFDAKLI